MRSNSDHVFRGVFFVGASFWKMAHMNERRKVEEFYDRLDKGEITTEVLN